MKFLGQRTTLNATVPSMDFELPNQFGLVVFFHQADLKKSFAEVLPCSQRTFSWPKDAGSYQVKILAAGQADDFVGMVRKSLEAAHFEVLNGVVRSAPVKGVLELSSGRIRIEKSSDPSVQMQKSIRVMVVDDSKTIRDLLTRVLTSHPGIEVVAQVEDPRKVEGLIASLKPDVITLDIHMPEMNGVELLQRYMVHTPVPTIMISSITKEEGPFVLQSLELGAFDYIQKPSLSELGHVGPMIVEKIRLAAQTKTNKRALAETAQRLSWRQPMQPDALIALGSSTGGTEALKQVFARMPENIPPIVVVQHIPPVFSRAFADRLNSLNPFTVKEAQDGDVLMNNHVYIAPGGMQMEVIKRGANLQIGVVDAPAMSSHKPSVDYLFFSLAKIVGQRNLAAGILTGMGADGAYGLQALLQKGAHTLAQDEATSVVYGMPRVAANIGAAEKIVPLLQVPEMLVEWASSARVRAVANK